MRTPTFADLRRFCREDHWEEKRRTDHWRYTKRLPDGTTARTKVSFGSGQIGDPDLFAAILRDQLHVSRDEFWRVVDHGGPAPRPAAAPEIAPAAELPAWLANLPRQAATLFWGIASNHAFQDGNMRSRTSSVISARLASS